jgi:hypothetical protein
MKLKKSINVGGTIIPAGTKLEIGNEGFGFYQGKTIFAKYIPTGAVESDTVGDTQQVNNSYAAEEKWKDFDGIEPGDTGYNVDGKPVRFLGKAVGKTGYDSLVNQFGNASDLSFDDIVNGYDDDEIKELRFVAYTTDEDGIVEVSLYGQDFVSAVEAEEPAVPFEDVEPGDTGISNDGKPFKVYATGTGKVWFENTVEAQDLELEFPELPEGVMPESINFVYGSFENGPKSVELYGTAGVRVIAVKQED